jgi:hypothetical protein
MLHVPSRIIRLLAAASLAWTAHAANFITFNGPNAPSTYAYKINSVGQVVGVYTTNTNPRVSYGYIRQPDGTLISILPQGATSATALAINDNGVVAGIWYNSAGHGYVRDPAGNITAFDAPDATLTDPSAINSAGTVTGHYLDTQDATRGFVRDPQGNLTTFSLPNSDLTTPTGINDAGQIAGWFFDNQTRSYQSFIRDAQGENTIFTVPGSTMGTFAYGINGTGEVTGYWVGSSGQPQGFFRDSQGNFTVFDVSANSETIAYAINDSGAIAGQVASSQFQAGLVRQHSGELLEFQVPGAGTGPFLGTTPFGINNSNMVTGWFAHPNGTVSGFLMKP